MNQALTKDLTSYYITDDYYAVLIGDQKLATYLSAAYLKKCSSVLGYSYVTSKSAVLLIAEKLDLNTFIAPTGGYEVFKKSANTVCRGKAYMF